MSLVPLEYSTRKTTSAQTSMYGSGKPGTRGVPAIVPIGLPRIGAVAGFKITNALPGATPFLLIGSEPMSLPIDGGTVLVLPDVVSTALPPFDEQGEIVQVVEHQVRDNGSPRPFGPTTHGFNGWCLHINPLWSVIRTSERRDDSPTVQNYAPTSSSLLITFATDFRVHSAPLGDLTRCFSRRSAIRCLGRCSRPVIRSR